MKRKKLTK